MELRRCAMCKEDRPMDLFNSKIRNGKPRISSYCGPCEKSYKSAYHVRAYNNLLYVATYTTCDVTKIGVTGNINTRLREIRSIWPWASIAAAYDGDRSAYDIERGIHALLAANRVHGSEVFTLSADKVVRMIDANAEIFGLKRIELSQEG